MSEAAVQDRPDNPPASTSTELAPAGEGKALNRTQAMGFGLSPRNFDEAWRMASILAQSQLVPKNYHQNPQDILVAMQYGAEIGLPPMASLQSVAVINGKPGVYGDGFLGAIQSTAAYAKHAEYYELADGTKLQSLRQDDYKNDDTKAVSIFWRKGNPEPFVGAFSIGDAKRAQLWGKQGPWSTAPARMLLWRARGYAGRNGFAAELRGIKTAEELLDTPEDAIDATSTIDAPPAEPIRRSEKVAAVPEPEPAAPAPAQDASTPASASAPDAVDPPTSTNHPAPAATASGPGQVTKGVRISATSYTGKSKLSTEPYYEIKGEEIVNGKLRAGHTWFVQDEQLAKMASSCEGNEALFTITWHLGHLKGAPTQARQVRILTGLQGA